MLIYILGERRVGRSGLSIGIAVEDRIGLLLGDPPPGGSKAALMSLVVLVRRVFGLLRWHQRAAVTADGRPGLARSRPQDEPDWRTGARVDRRGILKGRGLVVGAVVMVCLGWDVVEETVRLSEEDGMRCRLGRQPGWVLDGAWGAHWGEGPALGAHRGPLLLGRQPA